MSKKSDVVSAVVDTNIFVSGLLKKAGLPYEIVEAVRHGVFTLVLSEALYSEYRQVLSRAKLVEKYGLSAEEVSAFLFLVKTKARFVSPRKRLPVVLRDKTDGAYLRLRWAPRPTSSSPATRICCS